MWLSLYKGGGGAEPLRGERGGEGEEIITKVRHRTMCLELPGEVMTMFADSKQTQCSGQLLCMLG